MLKFLIYFRNTYIIHINETGDIREPYFIIRLWSIHQNVLNNLPRSNKAIEKVVLTNDFQSRT